jgi:hypothetical protein
MYGIACAANWAVARAETVPRGDVSAGAAAASTPGATVG